MKYAHTTPELLARTIKSGIFNKVEYQAISKTGAQKAASFINYMLTNGDAQNSSR